MLLNDSWQAHAKVREAARDSEAGQTRDDGKPSGRGAGRGRGRGRGKGRGRGRGRKKVSEEDVDDPDLKDLDKEDEEIKRELADEQGSDDEARK